MKSSEIVEVHPGPGDNAYRSDLYTVEVQCGVTWQPAYLYKVSRLATCYGWHRGKYPSVNFLTIGTPNRVRVRLTKLAGPIQGVQISPKSKAISAALEGGRALFTLRQHDKAWVTVDGDDANPVFIFADPPKPAVPAGADYFGPGVHEIGHLYPTEDGRAVYLDGGAWLKGNLDLRGKRDVRVLGPGVLSGELWPGESLAGLPREEAWSYHMIATYPDHDQCRGNRLDGITIVNAPGYHTFYGVQEFHNTKLISPWYGSTDGFYLTPTPGETAVADQCFAFVGDDVFFPRDNFRGNMLIQNSFVNSSNNNIFCLSYWANPLDHDFTMTARNIDIKVCPESAVFHASIDGHSPDQGVKNHLYEDIRVEGDLNLNCRLFWIENRPYPWAEAQRNAGQGNVRNLRFRNITVEGKQNLPERKSRLIGKDAANGLSDIVFEHVRIGGVPITESNKDEYFEMNGFIRDIRFLAGTPPAAVLPGAYSDPHLALLDGRYWIYPTSCGTEDWNATSFRAFSSADLREWQDEGIVLDLARDIAWAKTRAWAPAIVEANGRYYFYFTAEQRIGVAVADSPAGPFRDPLGEPLIAPEEFPDTQCIDPMVFLDDDGVAYLYFGQGRCQAIRLNPDMISFDHSHVRDITPPGYNEAPFLSKRHSVYYLSWSEHDTRDLRYSVAYGTAASPFGPFRKAEKNPILSRCEPIVGTGHHSILRLPGTDQWVIAFHRFRIPGGSGYNRETCLSLLRFDAADAMLPVDVYETINGDQRS